MAQNTSTAAYFNQAEKEGNQLGQDFILGNRARPGNDDETILKPTETRTQFKPTSYDEAYYTLRTIGQSDENYHYLNKLNEFEHQFAKCGHVPYDGALRANETNPVVHMYLARLLRRPDLGMPKDGIGRTRQLLAKIFPPAPNQEYTSLREFCQKSPVYGQIERLINVYELMVTPVHLVPLTHQGYISGVKEALIRVNDVTNCSIQNASQLCDANDKQSSSYINPILLKKQIDQVLIPHLMDPQTLYVPAKITARKGKPIASNW